MSQPSLTSQRAALEAEAERLAERIKANENLIGEDRKAIWAIRDRLHRLTIAAAVGVPDGVRLRIRGSYVDRRLDDATGVVVRVMRTRAVVDWGPALGRWRMPMDDLLSVGSGLPQGFRMGMGPGGGK
jgi:hypothetical protein